MVLQAGTRLGPYEVLSLIGAGGMGEVYRARDTRLDRHVALKVLARELAGDTEFRARFVHEAKTISALNHPHICGLYDIGREHDTEYLVLELIEGETLAVRLERGPLPLAHVLGFGIEIADALEAAHRHGITHRDLKPANIMLTPAGTKLLDFGLAARRHDRTIEEITRLQDSQMDEGLIVGTLPYMAPELLQGVRGDERSDIWAFGVLLHEMAAGRRPFTGRTGFELSSAILRELPEALPASVPAALVHIVGRCLAKEPSQRYQRAGELRSALEMSSPSHPVVEIRGLRALTGARPRVLAWATVTAAAVLVLGLFVLAGQNSWDGRRGGPLGNPMSLAILPLVNATGDEKTEYLSDGISDALINSLSQLPQLRVMARGTVFTYKGKEIDPRKVGQELDVHAVFSGRLTQHNDMTIVQADLANADDGTQIWGERYTRTQADLPTLQEGIAVDILAQLRLELTADQQKRFTRRQTDNASAYRLYLEGRYYSNRLTIEGVKRGIELMNQAIALDPTYALAYAGLADAYADASGVYLPVSEALPGARAAAEHALRLDTTLAEAHAVLGFIMGTHDWRWAEAEQELQRTIALRPSYARAHEAYGHILMMQGRADDAIAAMTRARTLDPLSDLIGANLGWFYYLARRYPEALARSSRLVEDNPNLIAAHYNLGMIYEQMGRYREALAAFGNAISLDPENWPISAMLCHGYASSGDTKKAQQLLLQLSPRADGGSLDPTWIGLIHAALGDKEQAFIWLEKAYHARSDLLLFLRVDPKFDSLRSDPRFADLVKRLNLHGTTPS